MIASEYGVPAIVGVKDVGKILEQGKVITMDGANGYIYAGSLDLRGKGLGYSRTEFLAETKNDKSLPVAKKIKTAANIFVNLPNGVNSNLFKNLDIDGLCYVRGENLIADIGIHPKKLIYDKKQKVIKKAIVNKLDKICSEYRGDVFYKISDYQNSKFAKLKNGGDWEMEEENKLLGYRGGLRHLLDDRLLNIELEALTKISQKYMNLKVILPLVRTISEMEILKKIISKTNLHTEIWLWASSPSNLILLPEFIKRGIDGFVIDLEHLANLILGVDSNNVDVNQVFSEMDSSVMWLVERANMFANSKNCKCILASKYAGVYPEFVKRMVGVGVDGFAVPFDLVNNARKLVAKAEQEMVV